MNEFIEYRSAKAEEGRAEIASLTAADRRDDADFAKVRTNIYEVCRTVTEALTKRPGNAAAVKAQFTRFRTAWTAALEKAREHNDVRAVAVEEIKLAALDDVTAHFKEATGE